MSEIEQAPPAAALVREADGLTDLERFETVVRSQLTAVGLPADGVFVEVRQRATMLKNLPDVLDELDEDTRGQSLYISKMIAAGAVGLFDAALNYLWDEVVAALRRRVEGFDLGYFYDIAAPHPDQRRQLRDASDLKKVDDQNLLRAAHEIGLLQDLGYQRLDHIRFMRNHASAAHPNQVQLTGLDLANWLEICVREVINAPNDTVTASTGKLLANIKKDRLDDGAVREAAAFFDQLPSDRAVTLANGLFGLYVDPNRTPVWADNVRVLWPELWPFVGEEARMNFGLRHARASASAETAVASAARELIDLVDGSAYLTDEVRAIELADAIEQLTVTHRGWNNFYNETLPARRVAQLVGAQGTVPAPVRAQYVHCLVQVFLGNGYGVANAVDIYTGLLQGLDGASAGIALRTFTDPAISSTLSSNVGRRQWTRLLDLLEPKLTSNTDRALMAAVRGFSGTPDQLVLDTRIKKFAVPGRG